MSGILDDAERDTRQTLFGRLLDFALIGATRKAKTAEIVSSETVIALARDLGHNALLNLAAADHAEEIATDRVLKARLTGLVLSPGSVPPAR
jgi:ferritin-like metal-binding protein YciE